MRFITTRRAIALVAAVGVMSCNDTSTSPIVQSGLNASGAASRDVSASGPDVVISQVYGGGGNSGAPLSNDYIELHNRSPQAVTVDGWSVQYASAAGTTWQVTPISGTIAAGAYYLVEESAGASQPMALPTPDVTDDIAMSATAGKVVLVGSTGASSRTCPAAIDAVSFGSTATNCGAKLTPAPSNTKAVLRGDSGCAFTGDLSVDFAAAAPAPRNSATPAHACAGIQPAGPLDHVTISGSATVVAGSTMTLTATASDASNKTITGATTVWSSSNPSIATVDGTGIVTGVAADPTPVVITATVTDGDITKSATASITVTAPQINWLDVSSSSTSFPPGFQTQLFITARVSSGGTVIPATFTFEALNPEIATVQNVSNTAIVTSVAPPADGTTRPGFKITATPIAGGTPYVFTTHPINVEAPNPAPTSIYTKNDEFGDPTAATSGNANDLLIVRPQYTLSYNESHGTPNWVSYELDARQMVPGQDRCNCFTADPLLPADKQIFTSDYTNGGFDRGHMTRSADRTAGNVDNADTFILTNVVPQQADLNQGVWAQFEDALADSAEAGRAVYIITGPLYSRSHGLTFLKDSGKVAIPDSTWKVAFIGPMNGTTPFDHTSIHSLNDVKGMTVLAVNMPNVAGVRNDPWSKYLTTVDKIEAATGFDFLSILPANIQSVIESGDHWPVAALALATGNEGSAVTLDASATSDADAGDVLSYAWTFGDGTSATTSSARPAHVYADNGTYTVTVTATDAAGAFSSATTTATVANVAPTVSFVGTTPLTMVSGLGVAFLGKFTDPGPDSPWSYSIDWGADDTPSSGTLRSVNTPIIGAHQYFAVGQYTVKLAVTDKDGGVGSQSVTVQIVRAPVDGSATPRTINLNDNGNGNVTIRLTSLLLDVGSADPSTIRIGTVAPTRISSALAGHTVSLDFSRKALIDAGVLTAGTTQLTVFATLKSGVQIVSQVPVTVH
ncbi:MAG TPA: DNA/RNA non-specific endonuclease [Gemmatimonadaceae bacterium]|jgi:DNA/RNA endonuclease G (NUC1)